MSLVFLLAVLTANPSDDLRCLDTAGADSGATPPSGLLYASLQRQAHAALDRRQVAYEQLKTEPQIREYQQRLRTFFLQQLGGFPERTPLQARVVGTLPADGYRIEKVIFESQPHHHVTANLYLPASAGPYPGVLVSSGHSRTGKSADYNQRFGIALALQGIAALCYDPIGQGERSQILSADGQPEFESTTQEHFLIGVGSTLLGRNTATYRIWDALRAIDYLTSRADIDPERIGMTGCSGGGTLTSYVMALDERVACAAPACYLTTFRRLIDTIGPQDAEQNIFGQIAFGLDQPDYVLLRAPRPTLISATTGDFFDIQGTWDNFRAAKRIYTRLGHSERIELVEAEGEHGVQPANLLAIVRWMRRWLLNRDDIVTWESIVVRPESELLCTGTGQVLRMEGERSVFDLNAEREAQLADERRGFWERTTPADASQTIRQLIGVRALKDIPPPTRRKAGKVQCDGYHIDKLVLETDSGVPLPALTYHPPEPQDDAYVYVHEAGKTADAEPGGPIQKLIAEGFVVVSIDLSGVGETAAANVDAQLGDWKNYYLAYLMGKSLVGLHTEDVLSAGHFVAHYETKQPRNVHLVGVGRAALAVRHAAALEPELFASVTLRSALPSWSSVVRQPSPQGQFTSAVHGALRVYDLPDLLRLIEPEKVRIE